MKRLNKNFIISALDFMRKNSINILSSSNFKIHIMKISRKTSIYIIDYRDFPLILKNIEFTEALELIKIYNIKINKPTKTIICYNKDEIVNELKLHELYNKPIFDSLKEEHKYYKEIYINEKITK